MIRTTLAALVIAAPAVAILTAGTSDAASADKAHDVCKFEDGSGQRFCVWPAQSVGNGIGDSFVVVNGGTKRAKFVYISDARAFRLTH